MKEALDILMGRMTLGDGEATCSPFKETESSAFACLVTVSDRADKLEAPDIVGLLVHEAVHVFQFMAQHIGEEDPSWEFEAYSIQNISLELFRAYSRTRNVGQFAEFTKKAA